MSDTAHIAYTARLSTPIRTEDWPLVSAASLDEAMDAVRGFGVFLMFSQGILWGDEWDDESATGFAGFDQNGLKVRLEVTMEDKYYDSEGNPL
jgi:hypothetical protein